MPAPIESTQQIVDAVESGVTVTNCARQEQAKPTALRCAVVLTKERAGEIPMLYNILT